MSNTPIIITSLCLYFKEVVEEEKEWKKRRKSKKREVNTALKKHDNLGNAVIMAHRQELRSSSSSLSHLPATQQCPSSTGVSCLWTLFQSCQNPAVWWETKQMWYQLRPTCLHLILIHSQIARLHWQGEGWSLHFFLFPVLPIISIYWLFPYS